MYAKRIREALKGAIDTRALAEAWKALHPKVFKSLDPVVAAFLQGAWNAISAALQRVLGKLWPEGWVLGQQSAQALATVTDINWRDWSPGDPEAALAIAGDGLAQLLGDAGVTIQSIASSRLSELGDVLAEYISSDVAVRPDLPEPLPPQFSVDALASELAGVLDNPERAYMVAASEVARAQGAAAESVFRSMGLAEEEISTAADARVCARCQEAEAAGAQPIGTYKLPLHPLCRCAKIPVLPAAGLAGLAGAL